MPFLVGTSGWQYRDWRDRFYPIGLPQRRWLEFYAKHFPVVEINNAFYRLPDRSTFEKWRESTPDDFLIAVKASRYLTHVRRLHDPHEPVTRLVDRASCLGGQLGPVLLQLPPTMRADAGLLAECLHSFPNDVRVAVEPRHESWWSPRIRRVLEDFGAALCWADRLGSSRTPLWRTAGWGYLRLHEGDASPWPRYGTHALGRWIRLLAREWPENASVFVFFNNDQNGAAIADARAFAVDAAQRGHRVAGSGQALLR